ncbi:MAG: hypothetical protein AAFR75_12965, partial [Pseudomonadota bacterium]
MRTLKTILPAIAAMLLGIGVSTSGAMSMGFFTTTATDVKQASSTGMLKVGYRYKKHRYYKYDDDHYDDDHVDAPHTRYRGRGRVEVDTPWAYVKRNRRGVRVRA